MKTKKVLMCMFLLMSIFAWANETVGSVKGIIKDATGTGLPYVSIEIYTKGETQQLVTGGMTDENGVFIIDGVPYGEYEMVMMTVGFGDEVKEISISQAMVDLGEITIGGEIQNLAGVEIRAEISQYRNEIDKKVINVGKDLVSAGADAAAVLNNIPSVSVDPQTGSLNLRGNENVKVMVDGKPTNIPTEQLLKQLPSNAIEKIEIITNPSAKYEAEGNSGIINIILQKGKRKGYNVNLDLGYTQGDNARFNSGVISNLNLGSFNFFANYNNTNGKNYHDGYRTNNISKINQTFGVMNDDVKDLFKVGFDWFISDKTALTVFTNMSFDDSEGYIKSLVDDQNVNKLFNNYQDINGYAQTIDYSLNLKQNINRDNHYLVLDGFYSTYKGHDIRNFTDEFPIATFDERRNQENNITRATLDYHNDIENIGTIEAGIQFKRDEIFDELNSTQELTNSENVAYNPYANFNFQRDVFSGYVNYNRTFGKLGVQLGVRAEQVYEDACFELALNQIGKFENDYIDFFPSAFFTYDVNDRGQLSLNYSRRIDRPHFSQISPVPLWTIATLQNEGNPDLKPQFTNSFELGYLQKIKNGSISATVFYRQIEDRIFRFMDKHPENENITVMKWINYDKSNGYGIELSANYKPVKWWNVNVSGDWYRNELALNNQDAIAEPWSVRLNNSFNVFKNFSIQNFFLYRGKYKFVQGEMQPMWTLDLGARYTFNDGKATLTARVSDIFNELKSIGYLYSPEPGKTVTRWESQTLYIGFSYNFGGDVRKRNVRNADQDGLPGAGLGL